MIHGVLEVLEVPVVLQLRVSLADRPDQPVQSDLQTQFVLEDQGHRPLLLLLRDQGHLCHLQFLNPR